jgi:hypothetical protein
MWFRGDPRIWAAEARHRKISREGTIPEARLYWTLLKIALFPLYFTARWALRRWKRRQSARQIQRLIRGDGERR